MKGWTKSFPASLIVSVMIFCMFYVSFGIVGPKIAIDLLCKPETLLDFVCTRSYAALRAADLDWIVGPGNSWGGYVWGVLNISFRASGTQLGLDFLSIDFFRIYFVPFKSFFSQILCFIQS